MKLPNWLKITLWLVLVALLSWLLIQRYNAIINGTSNATDIILFLIWIALIAAFIFQEVDFFGVRLKKEIDDLKSEVKEQIINLRSDIHNTINMKAEISPQINVRVPSSDSEIKDLEKNVKPIIEETLKQHGIVKPVSTSKELEVPGDIQYLFTVRYSIETELNNIVKFLWVWHPSNQSAIQIAQALLRQEIINPQIHDTIREVIAICNAAIHGNIPSETSIKFVRDIVPDLMVFLKALSSIAILPKPQWKPKE